ncbi:MAG: SEC-C domain-containing protein [Candidatus Obscuribacterales bacterium]
MKTRNIFKKDACPCGSGKKYKRCCDNQRILNAMPTPYFKRPESLYLHNCALLEFLNDTFNLDKVRSHDELKNMVTTERVRRLYYFVASIWHPADDFEQLSEPAHDKLRAFYMAPIEPDNVLRNIVRYSLYSDQIYILNPFLNPHCYKASMNALFVPQLFRHYTLKVLIALKLLAKWISAGIVQMVPDPADFNHSLRKAAWAQSEKRLANITREELFADEDELARLDSWAKRSLLSAPREHLESLISHHMPGLNNLDVQKMIAEASELTQNDPLALADSTSQLYLSVGTNLELSMYLSTAFGAFPYTDRVSQWQQLKAATASNDLFMTWSPLTKAFQSLSFNFLDSADVDFADKLREEGRLEGFRSFIRKTWQKGKSEDSWSMETARSFADELKFEHKLAEAEWNKINQDLVTWVGTAVGSFTSSAVTLQTGRLDLTGPSVGILMKSLCELYKIGMKKQDFPKSVPASVFMDLRTIHQNQ